MAPQQPEPQEVQIRIRELEADVDALVSIVRTQNEVIRGMHQVLVLVRKTYDDPSVSGRRRMIDPADAILRTIEEITPVLAVGEDRDPSSPEAVAAGYIDEEVMLGDSGR